jgi:putative membrane protein
VKGTVPEGETLSREHLANKRTLLSWIRTGINFVGVGILLHTASGALRALSEGHRADEFALLGMGLVIFGACLEVVAAARFVRYRTSIDRGVFTSSAFAYLLLVLGLVILIVALVSYVVIGQ